MRLTLPLAVGATVLQFNPLVDRTMAAGLGPGNVTALELGFRLFSAPAGLLGAILIAPIATAWAARLETDGWSAVGRSFSRILGAVVIVVPPLTIVGFLLRHDLVGLVYRSHAYTAVAVSRTADVFGLLLFGLGPEILFVPLSALFVIRGDTVFPMKVAIANATMNALLDLVLRGPLGVSGIALSTTVTYIALCGAYLWQGERLWGALNLRSVLRPLAVSLVSCTAIFVSCATVLGVDRASASRPEELAVSAAVLGVAATIHGSLMILAGIPRMMGIPGGLAWRPLATWRR
jgi:putative peptidoglycan lipid II flippase